MAEVVVVVVHAGSEVTEHVVLDPKELEAAVNEDIAAFDKYFQGTLNNAPILSSEKAIIKTYLWWKTHQEKSDAG